MLSLDQLKFPQRKPPPDAIGERGKMIPLDGCDRFLNQHQT
ncbi:hypothetical protein VL20_6145 [Microcystis panniformis FACHB-1757]|uniref:Uncharacterized protein n=1 Tax=Microcystis panniformis FACHB-1757 TaxID=1638788 RepID=A0A0K1S9W9_9CHRO|nr:hypothetical protein VL20_6145 [Microcystis panniformis FACHB-1757]